MKRRECFFRIIKGRSYTQIIKYTLLSIKANMSTVLNLSKSGFMSLSEDERYKLIEWCKANFKSSTKCEWEISSYSLKHIFGRSDGGFYVSSEEFQYAMLKAGFEPVDETKNDWEFKISTKCPLYFEYNKILDYTKFDPRSFVFFLKETYMNKSGFAKDNRFGDLTNDILKDRDFPLDGNYGVLLSHIEEKAGNTVVVVDVFKEAYKKYISWCNKNEL